MTRVLLVGDTSNRTNWGCRATTGALRSLIEERATISARVDVSRYTRPLGTAERPPPPSATGRSSSGMRALHRTWAAERTVTSLAIRRPELLARRPSALRGLTWRELPAVARLIGTGAFAPKLKRAIEQADVVIVNGEGSFLERRFPGRLKMLIAYTAKVVLDTPCAIVNHTSDVRDPVMHEIAAHVYPELDDVRFREPLSAELSGPLCGEAPNGFAADAAFLLRPTGDGWRAVAARPGYLSSFPDDTSAFDPSVPYIVLGGSSAYRSASRDEFDPVRTYRHLYDGLSKLAPVVLSAASHPDDEFLRQVARDTGAPLFGLATSTALATDLLAGAAAYVGGRWHPAILASTGGTPVTMFGANTSFKSEGFSQLIPSTGEVFPSFELEALADRIVERTKSHLTEGQRLRASIATRSSDLARSARDNLRILDV